jgi:hypothetical protein
LGTKIDYLFFPEYGLILERKKKDNSWKRF